MKLTQKQTEELIFEIAGKEGLSVYKLLKGKSDVNEFLVAQKLKLTINQIRNIFYKFQAYNLVTSTSKKDRRKGWYIYFFTFNLIEASSAFINIKREKIAKLEQQAAREKAHQFYVCPNRDMRATLENAMEHNFTCVECGQLLVPDDNAKTVVRLEKEIAVIKKEVADLESSRVAYAESSKEEVRAEAKKAVKKFPENKVNVKKNSFNRRTFKNKSAVKNIIKHKTMKKISKKKR
jgi:transcription initiation factor TFIIE subunit alpha